MVNKSRAMTSSATVASDCSPTCVQSFGSPTDPRSNADGWTEDNIDSNSVRVLEPTFTVVKVPSRVQQEAPLANVKEQRELFDPEDDSENHEVELKDYDNVIGEGHVPWAPSSRAMKSFISRVKIDRSKINPRLKNFVPRLNRSKEEAVKDVAVSISDESVEVSDLVELDLREQSCTNRAPGFEAPLASVKEQQEMACDDEPFDAEDDSENHEVELKDAIGHFADNENGEGRVPSSRAMTKLVSRVKINRTNINPRLQNFTISSLNGRNEVEVKDVAVSVSEESVEVPPNLVELDQREQSCATFLAALSDYRGTNIEFNDDKLKVALNDENLDGCEAVKARAFVAGAVDESGNTPYSSRKPRTSISDECDEPEVQNEAVRGEENAEEASGLVEGENAELSRCKTDSLPELCNSAKQDADEAAEHDATRQRGTKEKLVSHVKSTQKLRRVIFAKVPNLSRECITDKLSESSRDASIEQVELETNSNSEGVQLVLKRNQSELDAVSPHEDQLSEKGDKKLGKKLPLHQRIQLYLEFRSHKDSKARRLSPSSKEVAPHSEADSIYSAASTQAATESISEAPSTIVLDGRDTPMTEEIRPAQFSSSLDSIFTTNHPQKWTTNHPQNWTTAQRMLGGLLKCDPGVVLSSEQEDDIARYCASYLDEEYSIADTNDEQTLATSLESSSLQQYRK